VTTSAKSKSYLSTLVRSLLLRLACIFVALGIAGCAKFGLAPDEALSEELLELTNVALSTARTNQTLRSVLTDASASSLQLARSHFNVVFEREQELPSGSGLIDPKYKYLRTIELKPYLDRCHRFLIPPEVQGLRRVISPGDRKMEIWVASADAIRFVNVSISLREGCLVAIVLEQASINGESRNDH